MISNKVQRGLGAVAAAVFVVSISAGAMAADKWQEHHPRRAEVNHRLDNLNHRIAHERKDGQITGAQAAALHKEDHGIRMEERAMAAKDGGHITVGEQKVLNQQENAVSAQLGK